MATLEENEAELYDECQKLAEQLKSLQSKIQSSETRAPSYSCPEDLRRHNLKVLQHEENILQGQEPETIPTNSLVVADNFNSELSKTIEHSNIILEMLTESLTEMETGSEEKSIIIREQQQINASMQKQMEQQVDTNQIPQSLNTFARDYTEKFTNTSESIAKERRQLQRIMTEFLTKHFPAIEKKSGRHLIKHTSLAEIIKKLMRLNVETPENPYLEIQEEFWPPHIELLLRYNICCRHPDNQLLIKLIYDGI